MYFRRIVVLIGLMALAGSSAFCQERIVSADMLPREHWSYDAMAYLAAQGFVPDRNARFFQGDYLLDELEMAREIRRVVAANEEWSSRELRLLSRLALQFRSQLLYLGVSTADIDALLQTTADNHIIASGYVRPLLRLSDGDVSILGTYEANALAPFGSRGLVAATLSTADREYRANPEDFPNISKLLIKWLGDNHEWQVGRDYLHWGPGYSGSMTLSDNAPAFDFARFRGDFGFGRRIGRIQITQVVAPFKDGENDFWFLGRRWQKTFSDYFNMGINETVKTGKRPRPTVLVIPSLYWYQHIYLDELDLVWNNLVSLDAAYRTGTGNKFYGELVVDDMTAPSAVGAGFKRPRKAGLMVGAYFPNAVGSGRTSIRVEGIIVDPETYLAARDEFPEIDYFRGGYSIGHPVGSDAEALFLRVTHKATSQLDLVAEYLAARKKSDKTRDHAANLLLVYNQNDRLSTSLRWREFRGSPDERLEFTASYAF